MGRIDWRVDPYPQGWPRSFPPRSVRSVVDDDDGQQRSFVMLRDITERKRAEESLRQTAERLSLAQNAGRVGVFDWDLTTNHAFWTPELEAVFGLPQGTFENRYEGWAERVHPDDLPRIESLFSVWLQSDRDEEQWEYRYLCQGERGTSDGFQHVAGFSGIPTGKASPNDWHESRHH